MDKINNDPNKMPFLPFPPIPPKSKEISDKFLKEGDNLNKKPNEEPFLPFPPQKNINELNKKPNEEPFLPFPPQKKIENEKDNSKSKINNDLLEDKVKLSWKNIEEEDGFDLNQIKDVFIKSKSVM